MDALVSLLLGEVVPAAVRVDYHDSLTHQTTCTPLHTHMHSHPHARTQVAHNLAATRDPRSPEAVDQKMKV